MAPNGTTPAKEFTQRDMEIIVAAFQCLKAPPQVDYEALAAAAGFKNGKTASTIWSGLKKKYGLGAKTATPGAPRTPTPRKRKNAENGNGLDGSPSKKSKPETPSKMAVADDEDRKDMIKKEMIKQEEV